MRVLKLYAVAGVLVIACLCQITRADVSAENVLLPATAGPEEIKEVISMGVDTLEACIDQRVTLKCADGIDDKDVLEYEWKEKESGVVVGTTRNVVVSPKATVTYQLNVKYILRYDERIKNGDFELGESDCYASGPWWNEVWKCRSFESDYTYIYSNYSTSMHPEGTCKIVQNTRQNHMYFLNIIDHTKRDGTGYLLVVNGDASENRNRIVWKTDIQDVIPGKQYAFSAWTANIGGANPPKLDFTINGQGLGGIYDSYSPSAGGRWEQLYKIWTADNDHATIALINKVKAASGNDFTLDDISFAPVVLGVGEVKVKILPQVDLAKLADLNVCEEADLKIDANAIGSGITGYKWVRMRDGVTLSTESSMQITVADRDRDAGMYSCTVTGACGDKSVEFAVGVTEKLRNTGLKVDTVAVCLNEEARLSADRITGDGLKYSWRAPAFDWLKTGEGWLPVTADEVVYRKPSAGLNDAGKYRCVVTGTCGRDTVYSVLKVGDTPRLRAVANDTTVCVGEPVRLWVEAIEAGTDISWVLPDNTVSRGKYLDVRGGQDAKVYRYVLEKCGRQLKGGVTVSVFPVLSQVKVSRDTAVCPGGAAKLWITAKGEGLKYSWSRVYADGSIQIVGHTAELLIPNVSARDSGVYVATVTDGCGNLSGQQKVKVSLLHEYDRLKVTDDQDYCPGTPVLLEVTGGGSGLRYEWTAPAGTKQSGAQLIVPSLGAGTKGTYICHISGVCPGVKKEVRVGMLSGLKVKPSESAFRVCIGEQVVLRVNAEGTDLIYSWRKNNVSLGNTRNELVLNGITAADSGKYECILGSACGDTTLVYRVVLKEPTKIVDHAPDHKYVGLTDNLVLYVRATGENNTYVWKQDGRVVGGNSNYLNLSSVGSGTEGDLQFTCEVSGDCGTDRVVLNVHVGEFSQVNRDTTVRVCQGEDYTFQVKARLPECGRETGVEYRVEHNGTVYSTGDVMPFPSGTPGGLYTWYIKNECGEVTVKMEVVTESVPVIERISSEGEYDRRNDTLHVCAGSAVRLKVQAEGGELYEWQKDGRTLQLGADAELVLPGVTQDMAGHYACRVINDCGTAVKEVVMVVRKQLKIVQTSSGSLSLCEGNEAKLSVEVNVDDAVFHWQGGNSDWQEIGRGYISYYQNAGVKSETDPGTYVCRAESVCGMEDAVFRVDVERPLQLTEVSSDDTVCRGSRIVLSAKTNVAAAVCTWILPSGRQAQGNGLELAYVTPADTGVYEYHIKSRCVTDLGGTVHLSLYPEPETLKMPSDTVVCEGQPVRFVPQVTGAGLIYKWRGPNGFTFGGKTVDIPVVTSTSVGIYELSVEDICGVKQQKGVRVSLLEELKQVHISGDTTVCEGAQVVLSVMHDSPATYEWQFKGSKLAESRQLVLPSVSAQDTGTYVCVIKGNCSNREMQVHVGLYRPLTVDSEDALLRVCPGEQVDFEVKADGDLLQYVWTKESEEVGYRENSYHIDEAISPDAGFYKCRVSSACGTKEITYELQLKENTHIDSHSPDRFVSEHDSVRLVVRASGENNRYEWSQDGLPVEGDHEILKIEDVGAVDTLSYKVVVRGDCGVDSVTMEIKIGKYKPLRETTSPDTLCEGSTYTYVGDLIPPTCYGDEDFTYEWKHNGLPLPGNGPLLRVEELTLENAGLYSCRVSGDCGEIIMEWTVHVVELPEITGLTADAFVTEGATHRIDVTATGEDIQYVWQKDGAPYMNGVTSLLFNPAKYEDGGIYRVNVSNICSSVAKDTELKVWRKTTVITPKEQDIELCAGTDTVFRVEALGAVGLVYRWYHDGELLSVPMVEELKLKGLTAADAGSYKCIVSGRGGEDSCFIHLNVLPLPQAGLAGEFGVCLNDLQQEYWVVTTDRKLLYQWDITGGTIPGQADLTGVQAEWGGKEESRIAVNVLSSETGCALRIEKAIEYYPLPEVVLALPDTVGYCADSLVLDQGYPAGGYYLLEGQSVEVLRFTDKSGIYPVEYHYAERCASFARDTVRMAPEPFVRVADDRMVSGWCHPVELGIAAHSAGGIVWTGSEPLDVTDVLHPVYTAGGFLEQEVVFGVELTDRYGCKATDSVTVSLLPSPRVELGRDTVIGICQDLTLKADFYTDHFDRVVWSPAGKLHALTENTAEVLDKQEGENLYVATVFDLYGCQGSDTLTATVIGEPRLAGKSACEGDSIVVDCSPYAAYHWADGFEGGRRVLREPGSYSLSVTDRFGCSGETSFDIHSLPEIFVPDTLIFEGQSMEFKVNLVSEYEPYRIRWQDGSVGDVLVADKEGTYRVEVRDNIGCVASDSAFLTVRKRYIAAPDAFLPKSSSENSRFYLKEVNFVSRFEMFIYDRWGELVFKTNEIGFNGGWNGTFKGMDCQSGIYVWVAFADGKEVGRGTVMLVR